MKPLRAWQVNKIHRDRVELWCDERHLLSIVVLEDRLFRVWLQIDGQSRLGRTWAIAPDGEPLFAGRERCTTQGFSCPNFDCLEQAQRLIIQTQQLRLVIDSPLHLRWYVKNAAGEWVLIAQDRRTIAYMIGRSRNDIAHYMEADRADAYYGLGEKSGVINRQGRRYEMRNLDALGYDAEYGDPLYKHWAFYQVRSRSGAHYGLFYDNLSSTWFDLGNERDNYHGSYVSYRAEDGDLDYYFIAEDSTKAVTKSFVKLIGGHGFLPKWSLGYSGSTMHYTDAPDAQNQLLNFIDLCHKHSIPCDSFQLSSGYTSIGDKRYVFHWNNDKVPNPQALTTAFHDAGLKLAANIKPCLLQDHPQYQTVARSDLFIKDSARDAPERSMFWGDEGSHLDFTNPDTIAWWQTNIVEQLLEKGIDSTWNDNNEYEIWDDHARCHGFGQSIPIKLIRPLMSLLMSKASYQAQQNYAPNQRPYLISRSGCPGIQRYVQTWTGDNLTSWHTLKWNIRMGVGMSLSGMYHIGHDVGGFAGVKPDAELFVRWVQSCLLLPRFTIHSWNDDDSVNEPWMYPQVLPIIRDNLALRYALLPYLYTCLWQSAVSHEPIVQATLLSHEHDSNCLLDSDDYMIGEQLLVSPVTAPNIVRKTVYLPDNPMGWYDYYSHQYHHGGQHIEVATPLKQLPLWVRGGSVIAQSDVLHADSPEQDGTRYLYVFPAKSSAHSSGIIFDDDGNTHAWQKGAFYRLDYELISANDSIQLNIQRSGSFNPAYAAAIHIVLAEGEHRPLLINNKPHHPQINYHF